MLFDGVFAIAMTLLVLELKVPELVAPKSVPEMAAALKHQGPTFGSYLLSFTVLGMFWYRHNTQYRHFHTITGGVLMTHFVQLAAAASFPFCAAIWGRYPLNPLSVVIYLGCILVYAWASFAGWLIAKRTGAFSPGMADATYRRVRKRGLLSCVFLSALFALYVVNLIVLK
jgi:uncharacterized membrane protein